MSQEDTPSKIPLEGKTKVVPDTMMLGLPRFTPRSVSDPTPSTKRSERLQADAQMKPVTPEKIQE